MQESKTISQLREELKILHKPKDNIQFICGATENARGKVCVYLGTYDGTPERGILRIAATIIEHADTCNNIHCIKKCLRDVDDMLSSLVQYHDTHTVRYTEVMQIQYSI